ncbi:MAG: sulfite exporter TauE/SafE family protein [Hyphomicrobiales bacterium]
MTTEVLVFLLAGAVAGGFINGLAGTGTALFTLGFWLQAIPPFEAVAMVLVISVVSGIQGMVLVWKTIRWPRLIRFTLPALLAMPIGFYLLDHIEAVTLKIVVATLLIAYGGVFTFRTNLPLISKSTFILDAIIGFFAGILGALGGLSGALPTMWCALRTWTKTEQRSLLQPFNMIILSVATVLLYFKGAYTTSVLYNLAIVVPIALIGSLIGIIVFKRLNDNQFRRLLIALMLASGLILLAQVLLSG